MSGYAKALDKTWNPGDEYTDKSISSKCKQIIDSGKSIKTYIYGPYQDVILTKYEEGCATVYYTPTGAVFYFEDWDTAFEFAKMRAAHAWAANRIFS